jgi:hypothetical protein
MLKSLKLYIKKFYPKILDALLAPFDISSDVIVGLWSLIILIGCAYSIYETKHVSAPVATIFSVVITNFGAHRVAKILKGSSQDQNPDKKIDVQGEDDDDSTDSQS